MLTEADILAYHARRQSGLALPPLSSAPSPGRSASCKRPATPPTQTISPVPEKRRRRSAQVSALHSGSLDAYAHVPKPRKVKKKRVQDTARGQPSPSDRHVEATTPRATSSNLLSHTGASQATRASKRRRRATSPALPHASPPSHLPPSSPRHSTAPAPRLPRHQPSAISEAELLHFHAVMCYSERLFAQVAAEGAGDSPTVDRPHQLVPVVNVKVSRHDGQMGPLAISAFLAQAQQAAKAQHVTPHADRSAQHSCTTPLAISGAPEAQQLQSPWPTHAHIPLSLPISPTPCQVFDKQELIDQAQVESYLCLSSASSTNGGVHPYEPPHHRPSHHGPLLADRHLDGVPHYAMPDPLAPAPSASVEVDPTSIVLGLPGRHTPRTYAKRSVPLARHLGRHPTVASQGSVVTDRGFSSLPHLPPAPAPRHLPPNHGASHRHFNDRRAEPPSSLAVSEQRQLQVGSIREGAGDVEDVGYRGTSRGVATTSSHMDAISSGVTAEPPSTPPSISRRGRFVLSPSPQSVGSVASVASSTAVSIVLPSSPVSHFSFLVPSTPPCPSDAGVSTVIINGVHGPRRKTDERRYPNPSRVDDGEHTRRPGLAPGWVVRSSPTVR